MASGDDEAASKAGHMAAPTTKCIAHMPLANGEPSTHGAVALADQRAAAVRQPAKSTLPTFFGLALQPTYAIR